MPELWGGVACSIIRQHDRYINELEDTGHAGRLHDLDRIAALGIRTLRYPVPWEMAAPDEPDVFDWRWHDERLAHLQALGLSPVACLLHHGGGPHYTSLIDGAFPELLANYAARVAERYPWLTMFTPAHAPHATARAAGLWGHWHPHGRDPRTMLRVLVNQCRGIVLAMRAIRRVTPHARLIQTEELGKTFSFPDLRQQAEHENERRWLSFDLLCGKVDRFHPLYQNFVQAGIDRRQLEFFQEAPCAPDIIGIDHYPGSDRFLDRRTRDYPDFWRGDGHAPYVDVPAVRVAQADGLTGPAARLAEAWERYALPLAFTDARCAGHREDQLRWLMTLWQAACAARENGIDVRAVTAGSLLGSTDGRSQADQAGGRYVCGAFDARCDPPRPTVLARAGTMLAHGENFDHPALAGAGWWKRPDRFFGSAPGAAPAIMRGERKLLIIGDGMLGRALAQVCQARHLGHALRRSRDVAAADPDQARQALARRLPWAVIHVADGPRAAASAEHLALASQRLGIPYVVFSSEKVFDGLLGKPYVESDALSPRCLHGSVRADTEQRVLRACPQALVIRTSACFSPWHPGRGLDALLRRLACGQRVEASDDLKLSPTYAPDLAHAVLDLVIDHDTGIRHVTNDGAISWYELAAQAAGEAGIDATRLCRAAGDTRNLALSSERGVMLPGVGDALRRYVRENRLAWHRDPAAGMAIGPRPGGSFL